MGFDAANVKVRRLELPEVLLLEPQVFEDARGSFFESWSASGFEQIVGTEYEFVQDNQATSMGGAIRGLHYQLPPSDQGKLVRAGAGAIFDVVVDIRRSSPNFGKWAGVEVSARNRLQIWIPPGFAHGYLALTDSADVLYKTTTYYAPEAAREIRWDDPSIGIDWPITTEPTISARDANAPVLADAVVFD
jgi:dTDP-4-dehydrorhamnose 3,5-epimerase